MLRPRERSSAAGHRKDNLLWLSQIWVITYLTDRPTYDAISIMQIPKTLQQAVQHFNDYDNCKDFMVQLRWPDGKVTCPQCGSSKVTYLDRARRWKCYQKHDKPKFTLKTGTIFEDSPLG